MVLSERSSRSFMWLWIGRLWVGCPSTSSNISTVDTAPNLAFAEPSPNYYRSLKRALRDHMLTEARQKPTQHVHSLSARPLELPATIALPQNMVWRLRRLSRTITGGELKGFNLYPC